MGSTLWWAEKHQSPVLKYIMHSSCDIYRIAWFPPTLIMNCFQRSSEGCGRSYMIQRSRIWENQDFAAVVVKLKKLVACLLMMSSWSLVIIPKMESCLRWRTAEPGRLPARKQVTTLGVPGRSLWIDLRVSLWCCSKMFVSFLFIKSGARPEKRTGLP